MSDRVWIWYPPAHVHPDKPYVHFALPPANVQHQYEGLGYTLVEYVKA